MRIEIRSGDTVRVTGYVNVVSRDSRPIPSARGSFVEQVTPGTFKKALSANPNVEMRFNHGRKLCDQQNGLLLREDNIGLYADATFTDAEVAEKCRNHELRGWSFGFSVNKDHWDDEGKRYLDDINLKEVSILDKTPAYIATSVEMRDGELCEFRDGDSGGDDIEVTEQQDPPGDPDPEEDPEENQELEEEIVKAKALYNYLKYKMKYEEV